MTINKFLTENNKQVLEATKDLKLNENVCKLKKKVKQEFENCRKMNRDRLDNSRVILIEERVDEYFEKL